MTNKNLLDAVNAQIRELNQLAETHYREDPGARIQQLEHESSEIYHNVVGSGFNTICGLALSIFFPALISIGGKTGLFLAIAFALFLLHRLFQLMCRMVECMNLDLRIEHLKRLYPDATQRPSSR